MNILRLFLGQIEQELNLLEGRCQPVVGAQYRALLIGAIDGQLGGLLVIPESRLQGLGFKRFELPATVINVKDSLAFPRILPAASAVVPVDLRSWDVLRC